MTSKLTPVTPKLTPIYIGILADSRQVSVPSFKLIAQILLELCRSDPKIDHDPKIEPSDPKMNRDLAPPKRSVCTKFQVDSSKTFGVMLRKPNLTFVTYVTLKIKVTTPT